MPKAISDAMIDELSLVFAEKNGVQWGPINPEARILMVKGAPTPWLSKFVENMKTAKGALVDDGVPDRIDNDGDGADDYEAIVSLLMRTNYDLQSACGISDSAARSVAITTVIDNLLESLDAMREGDDVDTVDTKKKAGRRHSAGDQAKLNSIGEHADAMATLVSKVVKHVGDVQTHAAKIKDSIRECGLGWKS